MVELKPCPFCGGKAKAYHYVFTGWIIDCECGVSFFPHTAEREKAIEAWNRRVQDERKCLTVQTCNDCACDLVCNHNEYGFENCGNWISKNAVPVVRCGQCSHHRPHDGWCSVWGSHIASEDYYCADGFPKGGEE